MTYIRHSARLAALATAVALTISCDTRIPTASCTTVGCGAGTPGIGSDITAPTVKLALATGSTSADTIVYIGGNLGVTFTATDSFGVATISTTLRGPAGSSIVDSATFNPTLRSVTRPYAIDVATIAKGDRLVFTTRATDASLNSKTDSLRITVADTATPVVTIASKIAPIVKGLDSVTVAVLATDAAGIDSAGFMLLRVRGPGDTVIVFSHGSKPAVRSTSYALDLGFRISDTLPVGQYLLMPFAADKSGLSARNPTAFSFQLTDATRPLVTILAPTASGHVAIGDSILVKARLTDNSAVARVTFTGLSGRGNPALGTQDTVVRYATITAPSSGSFVATRDTTVTRYLKVVSPVDTLADTLIVRAIVTDASNNSTQLDVKVAMVPTLSISSTSLGATLKNGDTLRVRVSAGDTSAVTYYGYSLQRTGDPSPVRRDSVVPAAGTRSATNAFVFVLPDSLQPGSYTLAAFSTVQSAVGSRTATGGTFNLVDGVAPTVVMTTPTAISRQAVGDSLLVVVDLKDNVGVANVTFRAYSVRGDSATGTLTQVDRYTSLTVPSSGSFPAGTRSVNVQRYLKVITAPKIDSIADMLIVVATVTDVSGMTKMVQTKIQMTNGPKVTVIQPVQGDSITKGTALTIQVSATSSVGVQSLGFTLRDSGFVTSITPTSHDTTFAVASAAGASVSYSNTFNIPADAKGVLFITPRATDVNGQLGSGTPFRIAVRSGAAPAPIVRQQIASRIEIVDSVLVTVSGTALRTVGYSIHDLATDALVDSNTVPAAASSFGPRTIAFKIATQYQGKKVRIFSFAKDSAGNVGYSVQPNTSIPVTDPLTARRDTSLVVYGQNFILPRAGVAGDFTVDTINGNVFISNTQYNRLERWNASAAAANPSAAFDPTGVSVGSEPWGMVLQSDNDTLLVANSGGTNISKVCISATCGGIGEIAAKRLQTRKLVSFQVTETRDQSTGRIFLSAGDPVSYSDRPQYVQQSAGGRVFYSTKPTTFAPAGTIRYLDPKKTVPDPRQVYQYATRAPTTTYAILNSDSITITHFPGANPPSDQLTIYDHVYGDTINPPGITCNGDPHTICGTDSVVVAARDKVNSQGGDVVARNDVDVAALGLTDTTFVAASGDRTWIGFGEGNTLGTGRVMMVNDQAGTPEPGFFSPGVTVRDLLQNASERVFGLGIDLHGANVAVHGAKSYFASLESPFHLRLQGMYDTFNQGSGIAYHPSADMRNGFVSSSKSDSTRTAFVASANGSIEIVDAFNFVSRGTLQIKGTLYGPLRATLPFPTDNQNGSLPKSDPRYVILKLFGLTSNGLVVIDLRASDITPIP